MPALRHKRKSGTGTPLDTPADSPPFFSDPRKEKVQSSLDTWVEPALQNPTPSFEEHGFPRHGVLETMAPLGVPPNSKAKQKARGDGNMRRSVFGARKSSALVGDEEGTTPEMTPAPELTREDSERREEEDDDIQPVLPVLDEDEDDDYMPIKKKVKTSNGAKTPVRGKSVAQSKTPVRSKTPLKNGTTPTAAAPLAPVVSHNVGWAALDLETQQRIRIAVNDAIARSNKNENRNVGIALRKLLDDSRENQNLAKSLDGVIHQKESAEDWSLFRQFIKTAKKQVKRSLKIEQAKEAAKSAKQAQTESSPVLEVATSPYNSASPPLDSEPAVAPTIETAKSVGLEPEDGILPAEKLVDASPTAVAPHPLTTAPAFPLAEASAPSARKMGSKSPRKQEVPNGHLAPKHGLELAAGVSTPVEKTPDTGAGSDSALSDVDDDLINRVEAPKAPRVNGNGAAVAAITKKGNNAAAARAGKKSRANSSKPIGKHKKEKLPLTAEQIAQQAEIERLRQQYSDEQQIIRDQMLAAAPTSDIRFDDEILETESLTESQIAVGPPVDLNRPRRAGRQPRNGISLHVSGAKRPRDSSRFSSPQIDSAATSRPSTPAAPFGHMPSKRVKLNNGTAHQAARTKKS
jgi:hypothetical protein